MEAGGSGLLLSRICPLLNGLKRQIENGDQYGCLAHRGLNMKPPDKKLFCFPEFRSNVKKKQ